MSRRSTGSRTRRRYPRARSSSLLKTSAPKTVLQPGRSGRCPTRRYRSAAADRHSSKSPGRPGAPPGAPAQLLPESGIQNDASHCPDQRAVIADGRDQARKLRSNHFGKCAYRSSDRREATRQRRQHGHRHAPVMRPQHRKSASSRLDDRLSRRFLTCPVPRPHSCKARRAWRVIGPKAQERTPTF
jgi:hypothetical protein